MTRFNLRTNSAHGSRRMEGPFCESEEMKYWLRVEKGVLWQGRDEREMMLRKRFSCNMEAAFVEKWNESLKIERVWKYLSQLSVCLHMEVLQFVKASAVTKVSCNF